MKRVKGAERLAGLLPHLYNQIESAQELKEALPEGLYNEVFEHYKKGNKTKRAEVGKRVVVINSCAYRTNTKVQPLLSRRYVS